MKSFLISVSEGRAPKRRMRPQWLLLFAVTLLLASARNTFGQQPAPGESKELSTKSDLGKPEAPAEAIPRTQAIDLGTIDSVAILRSARVIFVRSSSILVKGAVVEGKLQKRPEFPQFGPLITRDASAADLVLELRHDLFTMYVYKA